MSTNPAIKFSPASDLVADRSPANKKASSTSSVLIHTPPLSVWSSLATVDNRNTDFTLAVRLAVFETSSPEEKGCAARKRLSRSERETFF